MQISDLIQQLAALQAQYGDLEVETFSCEAGDLAGAPTVHPTNLGYRSFAEYGYNSEDVVGVAEISGKLLLILQVP